MLWTNTGTGATINKTTTSPTYHISETDKTNGLVTFYLSSTLTGICPKVTDTLELTITPAPSADAGDDITICADTSGVALNASYTVAGNIRWESSGSGNFFPSNLTDNPTYVPSSADINDSTITLSFTTQNMGSCIAISDSLKLHITPAPTISAGTNIEMCDSQDEINIEAMVENAEGASWTTSGTGYFIGDGSNAVNTYTASDADRAAGSVSLTTTSTGNGFCNAVSDNLLLTITPKPISNAGEDKYVCADVDSVSLSGILENSGGNFWETYGHGSFFPDPYTENVRYVPTQSDRDQDSVLLALYPTNVGVCDQDPDFVTIYFSTTPFISAGEDSTYCSNSLPISLNGAGANGVWRGGNGTFSPDTTALNAIYTPSAAEIAANTVELRLHSTNNGSCDAAIDTVVFELLPGPSITLDNDHTICSDSTSLVLNASVDVATGLTWTSLGTGSFDNTTSNTPTYTFSNKDYNDSLVTIFAETTGNGVCASDSDTLKIFVNPRPTVTTGFDQTICETTSSVTLSGTFTNAGGSEWSTDGDGNFDNDLLVNTNYNTAGNDITNQVVELYLTTTGNGLCKAVTDTLSLTIDPEHIINSDDNIINCEDATSIALEATLTNVTLGTWSTNGNGAFTPNPNSPTTTYIPTNAESVDGNSIDFTFTTQTNNACGSQTKVTTLTFTGAPSVSAGPDLEVCANNPTVTLNGNFSGATGIEWSTSGNGTFDSPLSTSTDYTLSASEINAGSVALSITTTGNGDCQAYTDILVVNVTPQPTVSAGPDISICADVSSINISGNKSIADGIVWSSNGTGTFTKTTSLSTQYTPSSLDSTNGSVVISIETTGNGLCNAVTDNATITLTTVPTIELRNDTLICETNNNIALDVNYTISGGVTWTSSGSGTFSPNANTDTPQYNISNIDIENGQFGLTVTTTDNGTCQAVSDNMIVSLSPEPVITLPADFQVCETASAIELTSSIENATGITWSSSGSGAFNTNAINAEYAPSAADATSGTLNFMATSTGNGVCDAVTENIKVSFQRIPNVSAGPDQLVCAENNGISLNSTIQNATGGIWSTSDGSGTFIDFDELNTSYTSTAADTTLGNINLILTSTGNGVCEAEDDTVLITFSPVPYFIIEPVVACEDQTSFNLSAQVFNAVGGTWSFNGSGGLSPNNTDLNAEYFISPNDAIQREIVFTLTSTGNGVCASTSQNMTAFVAPLPTVDAGEEQIVCIDTEATLETTVASNQTYEWYDEGNTLIDTEYLTKATINNNTSFYVVVTNNYGCVDSDTVAVDVITPPSLSMLEDVCYEDSLIINANPSGIPAGGRFQWFVDDVYTFQNDDSTSVFATGRGEHKVVFTVANCQVSDVTNVHFPEPINKDSVEFCPRLDGTVRLDAGPAHEWEWDISGNTEQYERVSNDGYFAFTIRDEFLCENRDSIKVVTICGPEVYVPTGLIPGNPDKHFGVTGKDFTNYKIMVFNRWGEVIFSSEDPNETWDGTYRGEVVPTGVYPWVVKYEGITERFKGPYDDSGKVQVIR